MTSVPQETTQLKALQQSCFNHETISVNYNDGASIIFIHIKLVAIVSIK
jgi:hypothetical protein